LFVAFNTKGTDVFLAMSQPPAMSTPPQNQRQVSRTSMLSYVEVKPMHGGLSSENRARHSMSSNISALASSFALRNRAHRATSSFDKGCGFQATRRDTHELLDVGEEQVIDLCRAGAGIERRRSGDDVLFPCASIQLDLLPALSRREFAGAVSKSCDFGQIAYCAVKPWEGGDVFAKA
jgi:hypothetical protein